VSKGLSGLAGIMFEADPGADYSYTGFLRVNGVEYRFRCYREGREAKWTMRLTPLPPPAVGPGGAR
jgi:hypothetical protein